MCATKQERIRTDAARARAELDKVVQECNRQIQKAQRALIAVQRRCKHDSLDENHLCKICGAPRPR